MTSRGGRRERAVNVSKPRRRRSRRRLTRQYHSSVDPTFQAFLAAVIGAVVAGGAVLAWHISDRQQSAALVVEPPAVSLEVATVLSVLRSSSVVVDDDRHWSSRPPRRRTPSAWSAGPQVVNPELATWSRRYAATARSARSSW